MTVIKRVLKTNNTPNGTCKTINISVLHSHTEISLACDDLHTNDIEIIMNGHQLKIGTDFTVIYPDMIVFNESWTERINKSKEKGITFTIKQHPRKSSEIFPHDDFAANFTIDRNWSIEE